MSEFTTGFASRQAQAMPLLATKFYVPPPRATLVPRPRLMALLNQGMLRPLTLISAPAGSGKTTLVSEWRASGGKDFPLAWLSLDSSDNDPALFMTYLSAALGSLKPGLVDISPGSLRISPAVQIQVLLANLINDLSGYLGPFALALDDYHLITSEEIHAALTFLLDHLPQQMHLIILTRSDPPLPLARLRARDQLVEIRSADLRFTSSEAAEFFQQSMGLALSPEEAAALARRTEGWAAGLQLAALALQTAGDRQAIDIAAFIDGLEDGFSGSHPYVADYLSAEVLSHLTETLRAFLLRTSILAPMTEDLCDHLLERSDSGAILRQLEQANLFLIPLDQQRRWYRYHPLFAELLRSQLQKFAPDELPALHRRAAGWYERHGLITEAITHALAAGDQPQAARMIEKNAMAWLLHGDSIRVLAWIDAVAPLMSERPWLGIYQSWAHLVTGKIETIETRLQAAERWMATNASNREAQELQHHIAAIRVLLAERSDQQQRAIDLACEALTHLPESETTLRGLLTFTLGDTYWSVGSLSKAMRAFSEASQIDQVTGIPFAGPLAHTSIGMLLVEQGELHRAADTFQAVIRMTAQSNTQKHPVAAVACLGLAGLAYEWNQLDAAEQHAQEAITLGARWGNPDTLANARLLQARIQQARGDTAALDALRQAEELARGPGVTPWSNLRIAAYRVRRWLAQGRLETAEDWAQQRGLDPADAITYPRQNGYLSLARILGAQGRTDDALLLSGRLLEQLKALGQTGRMIEVLLFQALTLSVQGNLSPAMDPLAQALTLGEPEGYLRVFIDEGEPVAHLLRQAGSRGLAPRYTARLLSAFDSPAPASPAARQPLSEPLSERELQVLRLIANGLTNQAIAAELIVALGTVKTHTASLYRKLGVTSRTQAAARARELGLL